MIVTRFNTVIVRKDTLAAKWAGGVEGFKRDMFDSQTAGLQEDEFIITAGYSMGSISSIIDALTAGGLAVTETRVTVTRFPNLLSTVTGFFIGKEKALNRFGREVRHTEVWPLDAACAGMGMANKCDWLEPDPEHRGYGVRFKQELVKPVSA